MALNFSNLIENINLHIQEGQQNPCKINTNTATPRHIIIKLMWAKDKKKSWKQEEKINLSCKGKNNMNNGWLPSDSMGPGGRGTT